MKSTRVVVILGDDRSLTTSNELTQVAQPQPDEVLIYNAEEISRTMVYWGEGGKCRK